MMLPTLFVSHGAPTLPLTEAPARVFLQGLGMQLAQRPRAVLAVSAHWETAQPSVTVSARNGTTHDFYGFPPELYAIKYPAPGAPWLAERAGELLGQAGLTVGKDAARGLDHGAWVPLHLAYPEADVPVVQLSIQSTLGPDHHYRLGQILAPLRSEDVLVLASGSFTHDLSSFRDYHHALHAPSPRWVDAFADWMVDALKEQRTEDLLHYRTRAPEARRNHPTEEHLLPLFVALGAGDGGRTQHLHASTTHGILRMDAFAFGAEV